jgi:hypothetical protein
MHGDYSDLWAAVRYLAAALAAWLARWIWTQARRSKRPMIFLRPGVPQEESHPPPRASRRSLRASVRHPEVMSPS